MSGWNDMWIGGARRAALLLTCAALWPGLAGAEVRVQDLARLQGQRTNRLMGFGLVAGLRGTGDAAVYPNTARMLKAMHERFLQPVFDPRELKANANVAIVTVEAEIPEFGVHEGSAVDVVVSVIGAAKSLDGGQLLTTPLQESTLRAPEIFALAGGRIELPDPRNPTRGIIRGGAVFEQDMAYHFVQDGVITLVLNDVHGGFPMAQMLARAINHEISNPSDDLDAARSESGLVVVQSDIAVAVDPITVRVRIPQHEQRNPAGFITRVLETQVFVMPQQQARVTISRSKKTVVMTGTVTISPTVLHISGVGSVTIGGAAPGPDGAAPAPAKPGAEDIVSLDTDKSGGVELQELLNTLSTVKLSQEQMADAVEQLHRSGALRAQLIYTE